MTAKHTPGPWSVLHGRRLYIFDAQKEIIATITSDPGRNREQEQVDEANARLIAAAPDLLTALRELVAVYDCGHVPDIGAAIERSRVTIDEATKE